MHANAPACICMYFEVRSTWPFLRLPQAGWQPAALLGASSRRGSATGGGAPKLGAAEKLAAGGAAKPAGGAMPAVGIMPVVLGVQAHE